MRIKLLEKLASQWRQAENAFMESDYQDASKKERLWARQDELNLTKEEKEYLYEITEI